MAIALQVTDGSNITVAFNSGPLDGGVPGAPANSLQWNNNGVFGGVAFTSYANGNLTLGPVGNIKLTGGSPGQVLETDGAGNLAWVTPAGARTVETTGAGLGFSLSNTIVGTVTTVQFNTPTDLQLRSTLNIGNVANLNLNGNTQQWLRGDGVWANIPVPTTVANATYATTAGSVAAANVIGTVANAVYADTSGTATTALTVPGSGVNGVVANATYAATSGIATTAYSVDGANVVGPVASATTATNAVFAASAGTTNYAPYAGNVVLSNQPNITQLGTLLDLSVSGVSNLNTVDKVKIGGGITGQFLTTDGSGNLTWATLGLGGNGITSQPSIEWIAAITGNNQAYVAANLASFIDESYAELYLNGVLIPAQNYDITGTTLTINVPVNAGERITVGPVAGAVSNTVPYANHANYSDLATLANLSTFSTTANSVAGSNVVGAVANAGYSTLAATAFSVTGSNVVGPVANATYAATSGTANSASFVPGTGVLGAVANSFYSDLATSAVTVAGANITGTVANATFATSAGSVTGPVNGANVTGTVALAAQSDLANYVVQNAQPNITSVGTLTSLAVSGAASVGGVLDVTTITGTTAGVTINSGGVSQNITLNPTSNRVDVSDSWIQNVRDPQNAQDAATKNYVDSVAQGLFVKQSTACATTAPLAASTTYINGTLGVGATLVFSIADAPTDIDGYTLQNGDRILVKDQVDPVQNGIYERTTATTWTRTLDGNQPSELEQGDFLLVVNGIVNSGSGWIQSTVVTTIGTDDILYNQFSAAGSYTAGAGLQLIGSQFSMLDTAVVAGGYGNGTHVGSFTVNSRGQLVAATNVPVTPFANSLVGTTLSSNVVFSSLTTLGTLTDLDVNGDAVVSGQLTAGTIAAISIDGQLVDGYQPNIYQVGALANLQVIGEANIGNVSNVVITGGAVGQILTAVDANGNVQWSSSININGTANVGNLNVAGNTNLGNSGNIRIFGGNNGEVLHTYGNGFLYWANAGGNESNTAFQPSIEFIAPVSASTQTFSDPNIATFANKEYSSIYVNGSLQRQGDYTISGSTLTFNRYLLAGDEITVGSTATTKFTGGTVTSIATTEIDPDNIGFQLETPGGVPITTSGLITLIVPTAAQFAAAVNKKAYMMASYANVQGQSVAAVGQTLLFPGLDISDSVTYNSTTGVVDLQGNVVYSLRATSMQWGIPGDALTGGYVKFKWVYAGNGAPISGGGTGFVGRDKSGGQAETVEQGSMSCEALIKPTANTSVKLTVTDLTGPINGHIMRAGTIVVQQI
jgi:hypothetical protein